MRERWIERKVQWQPLLKLEAHKGYKAKTFLLQAKSLEQVQVSTKYIDKKREKERLTNGMRKKEKKG